MRVWRPEKSPQAWSLGAEREEETTLDKTLKNPAALINLPAGGLFQRA
jgi:hypothetical protein